MKSLSSPASPVPNMEPSLCLLCFTPRPVAHLTLAEDASGRLFGPVCRADAPAPVPCLSRRNAWRDSQKLSPNKPA